MPGELIDQFPAIIDTSFSHCENRFTYVNDE
jgi:hypothetical protein